MTNRRYTEARFMRPDGSQFHGKVVDIDFNDTPLGATAYDQYRAHIKVMGGSKHSDTFDLPCDRCIIVLSENDYFLVGVRTGDDFEVLHMDENGLSLEIIPVSECYPGSGKNPLMKLDKKMTLMVIEAFAKSAVEEEDE